MKRRIISLLISLVLIISMIPVSAMAAGTGKLIESVAVTVDGAGKLKVDSTLAAEATVTEVTVDGISGSGTNSWISDNSVVASASGTTDPISLTIKAKKGTNEFETYTANFTITTTVTPGEKKVGDPYDESKPDLLSLAVGGISANIDGTKRLIIEVSEGSSGFILEGKYEITVSAGSNSVEGDTDFDTDPPHWVSTNEIPDDTYTITITDDFGQDPYVAKIDVSTDPDVFSADSSGPSNEDWQYSATLTLAGLGLALSGSNLIFTGIPANPAGTKYSVKVGGTTGYNLDETQLAAYTISLADAKVGDTITVEVTASHDNAEEDATKTLPFKVTAADYAIIKGYQSILKVVADGGVSGVTFDPNDADYSGGYYFFNDDTTVTVKVTPILYYSVSSATVDKGTLEYKGTTRGVASYDITFPSSEGENGPVVTTLTLKTNKINIGDTAPTHYYTVKAYAGTGGTISPSGTVSVPNGGNQSFIIVPNSGYEIESVVVDGVNRGALNAFTFTDVDADHSIIASFRKVSGTVTPTQPGATLPPIVTPPTTIPATGAAVMVLPGAALLLAGIALLPKRRSK